MQVIKPHIRVRIGVGGLGQVSDTKCPSIAALPDHIVAKMAFGHLIGHLEVGRSIPGGHGVKHFPVDAVVQGANPIQQLSAKVGEAPDVVDWPMRKTKQTSIEPGNSFFEAFAFTVIPHADQMDNQKNKKSPA